MHKGRCANKSGQFVSFCYCVISHFRLPLNPTVNVSHTNQKCMEELTVIFSYDPVCLDAWVFLVVQKKKMCFFFNKEF